MPRRFYLSLYFKMGNRILRFFFNKMRCYPSVRFYSFKKRKRTAHGPNEFLSKCVGIEYIPTTMYSIYRVQPKAKYEQVILHKREIVKILHKREIFSFKS